MARGTRISERYDPVFRELLSAGLVVKRFEDVPVEEPVAGADVKQGTATGPSAGDDVAAGPPAGAGQPAVDEEGASGAGASGAGASGAGGDAAGGESRKGGGEGAGAGSPAPAVRTVRRSSWVLTEAAQRRLDRLDKGAPDPGKVALYFGHRCAVCGQYRATRRDRDRYVCERCLDEQSAGAGSGGAGSGGTGSGSRRVRGRA
ncbi:MAG: hypothetical protein ACRD0J_08110 [Acidimicrobiales bacterium]